MNLQGVIQIACLLEGSKVQGVQPTTDASRDPVGIVFPILFNNGTGAYLVNKQFHRDVDIAAGATHTYNLLSGLTDSFGDSVAMTAVKALLLVNDGSVALSLAGTNGSAPLTSVEAGGAFLLVAPTAAGYTTSGGNNTITVENASGSQGSYKLVVAGIQ